jgi:hypothetical protein
MADRHNTHRSSTALRALGCITGLATAILGLFAILQKGELNIIGPTILDPSEMLAMVVAGAVLQALCLRVWRARIVGFIGGALLILSAIQMQKEIEWAENAYRQNASPSGVGLGLMWSGAAYLLIGSLGTLMCLGAGLASLLLSLGREPLRREPLRREPLRNTPAPHCAKCGYSLHGLSELRCPECGTSAISSNKR